LDAGKNAVPDEFSPFWFAGRSATRVRLAEGDIIVTAPKGYCVDKSSVVSRGQGTFVLLADCAILNGTPETAPQNLGVLTVTVSAPLEGAVTIDGLAQVTPDANVISERTSGGLSVVHLAHGGDKVMPNSDPSHWRGAFLHNGRAIAMAAYGPLDGIVPHDTGGALLKTLAGNIREASPSRAAWVAIDAGATGAAEGTTAATGAQIPGKGVRKLFGRVFRVNQSDT
jgi:hypothetical protein